jgi:hypothetical protein
MKKLITSIIIILGTIITSKGQDNSYGLSVGFGNGIILKKSLDGGASYDLNTGFSIGLQYNRKLTKKLHLMTSINWYNNSISVIPNFNPDISMTSKTFDVQLIYIPLLLKIDLGKYLFFNGGLIADIDATKNKYISNQSGLGASFGIGTEFLITKNFYIQLNPYLNFHGLILIDKEKYPERILDSGIKLNLILKR